LKGIIFFLYSIDTDVLIIKVANLLNIVSLSTDTLVYVRLLCLERLNRWSDITLKSQHVLVAKVRRELYPGVALRVGAAAQGTIGLGALKLLFLFSS